MKLGIVVGHSKEKQGAYNKDLDITEYYLNEDLGKAVLDVCIERNIPSVLVYRLNGYSKLPNEINALGVDYCICLHHNASGKRSVNGTETLYYTRSETSRRFAQKVNDSMVKTLGFRDRGLLPREKGNGVHVLKNTSMPCILVEPYFMSNTKAVENRDTVALANAIIDGYLEFLGE